MKFQPHQDQAFDNTKETADAHHKRGGVTHFIFKSTKRTACRAAVATVGVNVWRFVNCIACLRVRKETLDELKIRNQPIGRFPRNYT